MKPLVYIAAPYTKPDPVENTHNAFKIADSLLDVCVPLVPHFTMFWHALSPKPYEQWLEIDRAYLRVCDAVLRIGGESSGADGEVAYARELDKPVFENPGELIRWCLSFERGLT